MLTIDVIMDVRTCSIAVVGVVMCAMAIITVSVMITLVQSMVHETVLDMEERTRPEVIVIEESPKPTVTMSTPRNSPILSPMRSRARRAGVKRVAGHRRACTMFMNPNLPGDCGYQCLLKIAGYKQNKVNVRWIRAIVADRVREARIQDQTIHGVRVHDLIAQEGLTLEAYHAAVCTKLWASKVELALGAKYLGASFLYLDKGRADVVGDGEIKYGIRLDGKHFTVVKVHKTPKKTGTTNKRAGMMTQWTWTDHAQTASMGSKNDDHEEDQNVTLKIMPEISDFVKIMYVNGKDITIAELKAKLSKFFEFPVKDMVLEDGDGSEIPDWCGLPACIKVASQRESRDAILDVHVPHRDVIFKIVMPRTAQRHDIEKEIANILGVLPHFLEIKSYKGSSWIPYGSLVNQAIYVTCTVERGGMNSVSTTEPYAEEERDPEIERRLWEDQVSAAGGPSPCRRWSSRSRSRDEERRSQREQDPGEEGDSMHGPGESDRSVSPVTSLNRRSASPTRHGWYSTAYPDELMQAQEEPICKPVIETNTYPVGYIYAPPGALVREIMGTMRVELGIVVDMLPEPVHARYWRDIVRIDIEARLQPVLRPYEDLRINGWELFKEQRMIPILQDSEVRIHVLVPATIPVHVVQARLNLWATGDYTYNLHVVDGNWLITKSPLQCRFMRPLQMYRRLASELLHRGMYDRGGMPDKASQTDKGKPLHPQPWEDTYVIVWVLLSHDYLNRHYPFIMKKHAKVPELKEEIADFFQHEPSGLRLSSHNSPLRDVSDMTEIITTPVIAHMKRYEEQWDYSCRWPINWDADETEYDTLDQWSSPPSPSTIGACSSFPSNAVVERGTMWHGRDLWHGWVPRGGGAGGGGKGRYFHVEPRSAMINWAHQRVTSELPEFNPATAMMLLKAENRTVSAALYCKSTSQLSEVMNAALRRAGLNGGASAADLPQPEPQPYNYEEIVRVQAECMRQLEEARTVQATKQDIMQVLASAQMQNQAQVEVIRQLADALARMEERIKAWEQWFLPEVMERLPHGVPPTPTETAAPTTPMVNPTSPPTPVPTSPAPTQPHSSPMPQTRQTTTTQSENQQEVTAQEESAIVGILRQRSEAAAAARTGVWRAGSALLPFARQ